MPARIAVFAAVVIGAARNCNSPPHFHVIPTSREIPDVPIKCRAQVFHRRRLLTCSHTQISH